MDWSTIKRCEKCGAGVPGDLPACQRCGGRAFGAATPGVPRDPHADPVASSMASSAAPATSGERSHGARLFQRLFRQTLLWTAFWLLLTTIPVKRLLDPGPIGVGADAGWARYPSAIGLGVGVLAIASIFRAFGALGDLKVLDSDQQWQRACTSTERWIVSTFMSILTVPAVLFILISLLPERSAPSLEGVAGYAAAIVNSTWFALSHFSCHLRIGQLCGMMGAFYGCPALETHAKAVVRNWWILLIEMAGLSVAGGFLLLRSGETPFFWALVLVWLLFVVYCFVHLAVLLWRTAAVLEGPPAGGSQVQSASGGPP